MRVLKLCTTSVSKPLTKIFYLKCLLLGFSHLFGKNANLVPVRPVPLLDQYQYTVELIYSNSCNSKNHLDRTNLLVPSEFPIHLSYENFYNSNSYNSKTHLN